MTEQKLQRNGRDFAIGSLGSTLLVVIGFLLAAVLSPFIRGSMVDVFGNFFSIALFCLVVIVPIITFVRHRAFIGIGILTVLIAVPLLLAGSCFGIARVINF